MNPRPTITAEEARLLRREIRSAGNLVRLGFITITDKGRSWIAQEDERIRTERAAGGELGARFGKRGGQPAHKKGRKAQ